MVLAMTLALSSAAAAQETTTTVTVDRNGEAYVAVAAYAPGGITPGTSGSTGAVDWPYRCFWFHGAFPEAVIHISNPIAGNWYSFSCNPIPPSTRPFIFLVTQYDPGNPTGDPDLVTAIEVRDFAEGLVQPPVLPLAFSPEARQITGVETWFWTQGSQDSVGASASAGGMTVNVEARFVETRIDVGEPDAPILRCNEQIAWSPGATTNCAHTYLTEELGRTVTATTTWDYFWWDNAGQPNPIPFQTRFNTETLVVDIVDLEAVITSG